MSGKSAMDKGTWIAAFAGMTLLDREMTHYPRTLRMPRRLRCLPKTIPGRAGKQGVQPGGRPPALPWIILIVELRNMYLIYLSMIHLQWHILDSQQRIARRVVRSKLGCIQFLALTNQSMVLYPFQKLQKQLFLHHPIQ